VRDPCVLPRCRLLRAAAGDGELYKGVATLVRANASVTFDLDPLHLAGCSRAHLQICSDIPDKLTLALAVCQDVSVVRDVL
jgi:hypothetical protein